ncbi:MAG: PilX N-terminal domain-containing pilus assembly protein [Gammaproteobacteria bacterium]|jgi:type IV pilus assembly protein PilX
MKTLAKQSSGFALITALLFLTVMTILGVSAVGRMTLQERMAANLREKGRADEAANAALRQGELWVFNEVGYPKPAASAPAGGDPMPDVWVGDALETLLGLGYADDHFWNGNAGAVNVNPHQLNQFALEPPGGWPAHAASAGVASSPQFFLEESLAASLGSSLTPASQGGSRTEAKIYFYRVSGRGVGGNASAISIHQSVYGRVY